MFDRIMYVQKRTDRNVEPTCPDPILFLKRTK